MKMKNSDKPRKKSRRRSRSALAASRGGVGAASAVGACASTPAILSGGAPQGEAQTAFGGYAPRTGGSRLDGVELPSDVVVDVPEIADIGGANERIGVAVMPPVEDVEVLAAVERRRKIGFRRFRFDKGQRAEAFVVGRVEQLRRRLAV